MKKTLYSLMMAACALFLGQSVIAQPTCGPASSPLCVPADGAAFHYENNTNFALVFSLTNTAYEFHNHLGNPVFSIDAATGDMETNLRHAVGRSLQVKSNAYAFAWENNPNYGLFFNQALVRYEFRTGDATPRMVCGCQYWERSG